MSCIDLSVVYEERCATNQDLLIYSTPFMFNELIDSYIDEFLLVLLLEGLPLLCTLSAVLVRDS